MRTVKKGNILAHLINIVCLALAFAGCGPAASTVSGPPDHGFGYDYTFDSPEGVRFRNDGAFIVLDSAAFDSLIVQPYREMEICTGVTAPGPLVVPADLSTQEAERGLEAVGGGWTYLDTGLVLISVTAITDPYYYTGNPATGRTPGTSTLRHEYVHHLLRGQLSPEQNAAHASPLFHLCSGLG